jgi:magnesium-transporting ATPase (P-type)
MINSFCSYFEIFAGLNLGYATIRGFREAANSELFGLKKKYSQLDEQIDILVDKVNVATGENSNGQTNLERLNLFKKEFDTKKDGLEEKIKKIIELGIDFQMLFFITCIFCFFILILGGFESYFEGKINSIKILSYFNVIYIFFSAIIALFALRFKDKFKWKSYLPFVFFFIESVFLLFYIFRWNFVNSSDWTLFNNTNSVLTLLLLLIIPPLPFIVFYIRRYKQSKIAQEEIDKFSEEYKNKLHGFTSGIGISIQE